MSDVFDAGGIACRVLVDGGRAVSPRFVFRGYDDDIQGPFVRPHLDDDGKLYGRFAGLLIEAPEGMILVDAGVGGFAGDLDAGHLHEELATLGVRPVGHPDRRDHARARGPRRRFARTQAASPRSPTRDT